MPIQIINDASSLRLPKRFKNNKPLALISADSALYNLTAAVRGIEKSVIDDQILGPAVCTALSPLLCFISSFIYHR